MVRLDTSSSSSQSFVSSLVVVKSYSKQDWYFVCTCTYSKAWSSMRNVLERSKHFPPFCWSPTGKFSCHAATHRCGGLECPRSFELRPGPSEVPAQRPISILSYISSALFSTAVHDSKFIFTSHGPTPSRLSTRRTIGTNAVTAAPGGGLSP